MYINIEDIDINQLRKDLIDYYTSAMFIVSGSDRCNYKGVSLKK